MGVICSPGTARDSPCPWLLGCLGREAADPGRADMVSCETHRVCCQCSLNSIPKGHWSYWHKSFFRYCSYQYYFHSLNQGKLCSRSKTKSKTWVSSISLKNILRLLVDTALWEVPYIEGQLHFCCVIKEMMLKRQKKGKKPHNFPGLSPQRCSFTSFYNKEQVEEFSPFFSTAHVNSLTLCFSFCVPYLSISTPPPLPFGAALSKAYSQPVSLFIECLWGLD